MSFTNILPDQIYLQFLLNSQLLDKNFAYVWVETWSVNSGAKMSILKYLCSPAEAEAKFNLQAKYLYIHDNSKLQKMLSTKSLYIIINHVTFQILS